MAGTDLARVESFPIDIIAPAADLAQRIAKTEFVPTALRNRPEAVLACMLAGNEIGIGPMQSLSKIHIIEGRPAMAAELMRAIVQRDGHEVWFEDTTNTKVTICGRRKESDHVTRVTWTMDDAKRAQLDAKQNWRRYPRQMLVARATGDLCRMVFADVLGGISYTPEELEDGVLDVAPVDDGEPEPPKTTTRKAAPAKKAAAPRAAAPAGPVTAPPLPPLPGEEGFDEPTAPATDADAVKLAQKVAIRCQEAGLDDDGRHNLIRAITNGVKASGKDLTGEEGAEVIEAARGIADGRLQLLQGEDDRWQVVAVEDATGGTDPEADDPIDDDENFDGVGDESGWTADKWRAYLAARSVRLSTLIREAQRLASELGVTPPGSLDGIVGESSLCSLLRGFVEEQNEAATA